MATSLGTAALTADTRGLRAGSSITLSTDPNRVRRRVRRVLSRTEVIVEAFARPSRGWARHVRRMKAGV